MNTINAKKKSISLLKFTLPLFVLVLMQIGVKAQNFTQAEQNCFNMVQNKVAYDKAGNKVWSEPNIRNLCKGTTNPTATISCFTNVINNFNDWNRGTRECSAPPASNSNNSSSNLSGNWEGFYPNGTKSSFVWRIEQNGAGLTFEDVGAGTKTKFSGKFVGNKITDINNKTGTISGDEKTITWSDGVVWRKTTNTSVAATSQTETQEEKDCVGMVQDQVAWAKGGSKHWTDANLRSLCKGTTWASRTIDCFSTKIRADIGWAQAINECQPSAFPSSNPKPTSSNSNTSTTTPVSGKYSWLIGSYYTYDRIGRALLTQGRVYYEGSTLMIDNGLGQKSELLVAPTFVTAKDWNKMSGFAKEGSAYIDWSLGHKSEENSAVEIGLWKNGSWKKIGTSKVAEITVATDIPDLTGNWTLYDANNVKKQTMSIEQHLYKIKYKSSNRWYGVADIEDTGLGIILTTWAFSLPGVTTVAQGGSLSVDRKKVVWNDRTYWVKE